MARTVPEKIREMMESFPFIRPGERILTALSGGADSVCLLLALKELGYEVCAAHVEHGIRGEESLEDRDYVRQLCMEENIRLYETSIDAPSLAAARSRSLEETAREERYSFFRSIQTGEGIHVLATAHHMGDQAETVLWNLIRGCSLKGLGGIAPSRETDGLYLIRPLIGCTREEITAFLGERGISWRTDRTNLDTDITRNAIRLQILPQMERLNPAAKSHIAWMAADLRGIEEYLEAQTKEALERAVISTKPLIADVNELRGCPEVILSRVLRGMLGLVLGGYRDIGRRHTEDLMALTRMDNGHEISLPGGVRAVREEGILRFETGEMKVLQQFAEEKNQSRQFGTGEMQTLTSEYEGGMGLRTGGPCEDALNILLKEDREFAFFHEGQRLCVSVRYGVWEGKEVPKKKYTKHLAYDTMATCLTLRTRRKGDYLIVNSAGGRRKLKDYLIDEKIPRSRRDSLLLFAQGSHVLWIVGMRISEAAKVSPGMNEVEVTVSGMDYQEGL